MRLTLRTLLAYLDDILDEQDAQELKSKIDESEIATQLVQRIGQVGQTRLDAPHLEAQGIGADANSVAEYLDNTLPAEQVPDFEQACLDSDMHLSEVAACHQILTLVLGEPAEISPQLKRAIHNLGSDGSAAGPAVLDRTPMPSVTKEREAATEPAQDPPPATASAPVPLRDADEHWTKAPDYLVKHRRSIWKPVIITALIFICLAIAGLSATGPLNRQHPLAQLILGTEVQPGYDDPEIPQTTIPAPGDQLAQDAASDNGANDDASIDTTPTPTDVVPAEFPETPLAGDDEPMNDSEIGLPDTHNLDLPPDVPTPTDEQTSNLTDSLAVDPDANNAIVPPDPPILEQPDSVRPDLDQPEGIVPVFNNSDADNAVATDLADPDEPDVDAEGPREIGRYLSEDQVLARFNPTSNSWESLPARQAFIEDDQLMVFPFFRPQLMLSTGMQVTLVGPARAQLLAQGPNEMPNVRLDYGRAAIVTFAQSGTMIGIAWGTQSATAKLADTSSTFAVEADRQHAPGSDFESDTAHTVLRVTATSGDIEWQMAGAESIPLTAGQQLLIVDAEAPQIVDGAEIPLWIDGRDARPRDPIATKGLKPYLTEDRPVSLSLREQAESNREEVRSLAVCSLAYLGEFDPLLVALNDSRLRSYWTNQYEVLQHIASLDNETATRVRQAIEERHGEDGKQLFRMLSGFSPAQLEAGGAQLLVDYLDHESSDFRVAAIENLRAITGIPSLYMPHYDERMRRKHIVTWRNKLTKGQIKYRDPPAFSQPVENP